jgi:hypothetical protein
MLLAHLSVETLPHPSEHLRDVQECEKDLPGEWVVAVKGPLMSGLFLNPRVTGGPVFFASEHVIPSVDQFSSTFCRRDLAAGVAFKEVVYNEASSTSTLCTHLIKHHVDDWIESCDSQNIDITAHAAERALRKYRLQNGGTVPQFNKTGKKPRVPFTQEAFEDAIVEFIVADDQVRPP